MGLIQVQTTFATEDDALVAARALVSEKLAACCQVVPGLTSVYMWEGVLRHEPEVLLLLKSTEQRWPDLRDRLLELHPYDTPELIATAVSHVGFEYMAWVKDNVE
ncbi:MAG: divalent-cation tolerance protein CutA [bacterium]|nr:divalent-cation tolerance protein CutA [bacterium]